MTASVVVDNSAVEAAATVVERCLLSSLILCKSKGLVNSPSIFRLTPWEAAAAIPVTVLVVVGVVDVAVVEVVLLVVDVKLEELVKVVVSVLEELVKIVVSIPVVVDVFAEWDLRWHTTGPDT